jgi:hypothetical protein
MGYSDLDKLREWVISEREALWADLQNASRRAIRAADPNNPETWSIEMHGIADRIRDADRLHGAPVAWQTIGWEAFPYYERVSGVPLSDEAWEWLAEYITRDHKYQPISAERALQFRPVTSAG